MNKKYNEKIIEEIKEESITNFKDYINLFKYNAENNNSKDIESFIELLFSDLFPENILTNNTEKLELIKMIYDNDNNIINYFEKYFNNLLFDKNDYIISVIKEKIIEKNKSLLKKINECNSHINIIQKYYIYLKISQKITIDKKEELNFTNKSVLVINDKKNMLKMGEIFIRYLFCIIKNNKDNTLSLPNNFYNSSKMFNFIEGYIVHNFITWEEQIKYFLLIILLINIIFNDKSNYTDIFSIDYNKKIINELIKVKKSTNKKKDNKKKKDSKKGKDNKSIKFFIGGKQKKKYKEKIDQNISNILNNKKISHSQHEKKNEIKRNLQKITNSNQNNIKNKCIEILKNTEISTGDKNNSITLYSIYYTTFIDKIKIYFENIIKKMYCLYPNINNTKQFINNSNINKNREILIDIQLKNPFYENEKINLKDYYNFGKTSETKIKCESIHRLFNNFNFDIFQILNTYKDSTHENKLNIIIKNIQKKIILLLYSLYSNKKNLYEKYIEISSKILKLDNNNITKSNNKKISNSITNNLKSTNLPNLINSNSNLKKKNNDYQKKIQKKIHEKIKKKNENDIIVLHKLDNNKKEKFIKVKYNINILEEEIKNLENNFDNKNYDSKKLLLEKKYHKLLLDKMKFVNSVII